MNQCGIRTKSKAEAEHKNGKKKLKLTEGIAKIGKA
jgi:hypothetical protein